MAAVPAATVDTYPAKHRAGLTILLGSGAIGIVAALFLPMTSWGFGFPAVVLGIFAGSLLVQRHSESKVNARVAFLWIGVLLFSLLVGWRDAPELRFLNVLMVLVFAGILALRTQSGQVSKGSVYDYPFRALGAWFVAFVDTFNLILNDIAWKMIPRSGRTKHAASVMRGLLLAAPLLLIFGVLFASADARFEKMFTGSLHLDGEVIAQQAFMGFGVAWLVAGLFRRMYTPQAPTPPPVAGLLPRKEPSWLGRMELGIVLGSLNILFLLFVSTQWRYFFGGAEVVRQTAGLGVADFARRGFFELVAVAGLALPTLLGLHALIDPDSQKMQKLYKVLASSLVILLTVVMHSAWLKMQLYMGSFGLSTQRIYVAATLGWLAIVFVWFALTTLNQRGNRFAWGGLLAMAATVVGLNFINPDRFVAKWNIQHQEAAEVDWNYLSKLSADAAPTIAKAWETIPKDQRASVAQSLSALDKLNPDWRSQNLSLLSLGQLLGKNRDEIKAIAEKADAEAAERSTSYYD